MRWVTMFALALAAWAQDLGDDAIKKFYPQAASIKSVSVELSDKSREKIKAALGAELTAEEGKGKYASFTSELYMPRRDTFRLRTLIFSMEKFQMAVTIIAEEDTVASVHVIGNDELEKSPFVGQFFFMRYNKTSLFRPVSELEARLKKAEQAKDDEGRVLKSLVTIKRAMKRMGLAYGRVSDGVTKKSTDEASAAKDMSAAFQSVGEAAEAMSFLQDSARFKGLAVEAKDMSERIAKALADKEFDKAKTTFDELSQNACASCHGSYLESVSSKRDDVGLGDGYFSTELDVVKDSKLDAATQSGILRAIRKAVMILVESK